MQEKSLKTLDTWDTAVTSVKKHEPVKNLGSKTDEKLLNASETPVSNVTDVSKDSSEPQMPEENAVSEVSEGIDSIVEALNPDVSTENVEKLLEAEVKENNEKKKN